MGQAVEDSELIRRAPDSGVNGDGTWSWSDRGNVCVRVVDSVEKTTLLEEERLPGDL